MPIIQVEALPQAPDVDLEQVLGAVCAEVSLLLGEAPRGDLRAADEVVP